MEKLPQTVFWRTRQKERERLTVPSHPGMFVLIGLSLLSIVRSSGGDTGATQEYCQSGFCVTLKEAVITGEAGLCVVIPCSFSTPYWFSPQEMIWFKCESWRPRCPDSETIFHSDQNNPNVQSGFRGRVSLLEPDIRQKNCSIIINDLTESDSGSYQFRLTSVDYYGRQDGLSFSRRAAVEVTALTQKPTLMVPTLVEGQQSTLRCTAPGLCSGSGPDITWSWRGTGENTSYVTTQETEIVSHFTQRHSSTLTLNSSAENHGENVVCEVRFKNGIRAEEAATLNVTRPAQGCRPQSVVIPWVVTAISLVVGVVCIICVICLLIQRSRRRRRQPNLEDRTYMSLKKPDISPEYNVIGQPVK